MKLQVKLGVVLSELNNPPPYPRVQQIREDVLEFDYENGDRAKFVELVKQKSQELIEYVSKLEV